MLFSIHDADFRFLKENLSYSGTIKLLEGTKTRIPISRGKPGDFSFELTNQEAEVVQEQLAVLLTEIGLGDDGEPNIIGTRIERLIDLFCSQG